MSQAIPDRTVTLLMGSTRPHGSTRTLLDEAARALTARGIGTETIVPDRLLFSDCRGCHGCRQEGDGRCVIDDDMQGVYRAMERSQGLIVAAPVYFGYVPAMTKAWLDRLVPYIGPGLTPRFPAICPVSFIFVQNVPDPAAFAIPLQGFMDSVAMTGLVVQDCLIAPDCEVGEKVPVSDRPDLMERAYAIGRDLPVGY